MADPKKILMLTNSELGQANVFLAVAHELLQADPSIKIYICSFAPLQQSVSSIRKLNGVSEDDDRLNFIEIKGTPWKDALFGRSDHQFQELCDIRPSVFSLGKMAKLTRISCPWTSDELCDMVQQVEKTIQDLNPQITVVDNLFTPAVTVCYKLKPRWTVLSPNTYKEFALAAQPQQQYYWKYPPPNSTISYPVPWYQIPLVWYSVRKMYLNHNDTWMLDHAKQMKDKIDTDYADWAYISIVPPEGLQILLATLPEIDFPFQVLPGHMIACGPMIRPSQSVAEADAELLEWLSKVPTILVNLGTHASYDENHALQTAKALDMFLDAAEAAGTSFQVLWKLNKRTEFGNSTEFNAIVTKWKNVLRVTDWLNVEPSSLFESGHIVVSVNHGGANSFFEAVSAGIPQVILPVWGDTYDFAKRVEWLGIGKFGSPNHAPKVSAKEFSQKLKQVALGSKAPQYKQKAKELAELCDKDGGGRRVAANKILEMVNYKANK